MLWPGSVSAGVSVLGQATHPRHIMPSALAPTPSSHPLAGGDRRLRQCLTSLRALGNSPLLSWGLFISFVVFHSLKEQTRSRLLPLLCSPFADPILRIFVSVTAPPSPTGRFLPGLAPTRLFGPPIASTSTRRLTRQGGMSRSLP